MTSNVSLVPCLMSASLGHCCITQKPLFFIELEGFLERWACGLLDQFSFSLLTLSCCNVTLRFFFVLFCFLSEKKPTKGTVAELSPSPFASALPVQHRQLILYQGHLFFRTPVILHRPGRSCYVAFSLVKISAAVLSLLTLPFQFSYYINFVFWVIFWKTLHLCKCENANHITEQIPLLGEFPFSSQTLELTPNPAF